MDIITAIKSCGGLLSLVLALKAPLFLRQIELLPPRQKRRLQAVNSIRSDITSQRNQAVAPWQPQIYPDKKQSFSIWHRLYRNSNAVSITSRDDKVFRSCSMSSKSLIQCCQKLEEPGISPFRQKSLSNQSRRWARPAPLSAPASAPQDRATPV